MTDELTTPLPTARYRLRTFGTLALVGPDGATVLGTHGQQHRRLALLAALAASGSVGRSRDQLLLLFWPDGTQARGRHSLDQLLYTMRSSIDEGVFIGMNPVRLNLELITSDIADFHAALERGDNERAVGMYRGPFLDGFHLANSPEFEQWLEAERSTLSRSYAGALEQLARSAEASGDHASAARWWRTLGESDPLSKRAAAGLIRALISDGDHAAALLYAEKYESVLGQQLGVGVDPAIAALVAEIRAASKTNGAASSSPAVDMRGSARQPQPTLESELDSALELESDRDPVLPGLHPTPQRPPRRRVMAVVVACAVIIMAIGFPVWLRDRASSSPPPRARTIAVLPFANTSGDAHDAALVDGLSEEIISALNRIPDLRVTPRTSAFAFRNTTIGLQRIADSLGVAHIVEGSVQRIGSRIRVHIALVDAGDGSTRWRDVYDRELADIFALQSEIATAVARELDVRLTESTRALIARNRVRNIAAYELYLRGNSPVLLRSDSGARAGLEYFRQAVALDSTYAAAYAGLARMQMRIGFGDDQEMSRFSRLALAEQAALTAVALDDSSGDAHAALSMVRRNNYELAAAEAELRHALALEPTNARFHEWMVLLDLATGRPDEALRESRLALELDPLSPTANAEVANALLANDRCDEALVQLERLQSLRPPLLRAGAIAGQCYARKKMWPEAIAAVERIVPTAGPRGQSLLGYMLARAGRTKEAERILAELIGRARQTGDDAFEVAIVYAGLGRDDETFTWLNMAVDDRSFGVEWLPAIVDDLRGDARFETFRRRAGFRDP